MNTKKLIEAQRILDKRIYDEHKPENLEEEGKRSIQRIVANIVELAEFMNETRIFKYWSNKQPDRSKMLEEYVDGVHFFLGIAIERHWEEMIHNVAAGMKECDIPLDEVERTYLAINFHLSAIVIDGHHAKFHFETAWLLYLALGFNAFGFTADEIEASYFAKNQINHDRQASGY